MGTHGTRLLSAATLPRAHVPPAVGGIVAETVQQCAVNLGDVLSAHNLVRGPFGSHTDGPADPAVRSMN